MNTDDQLWADVYNQIKSGPYYTMSPIFSGMNFRVGLFPVHTLIWYEIYDPIDNIMRQAKGRQWPTINI